MINKDNSIHSRIRVSSILENGRTYLKESYYDIPYKIVHYGSRTEEDYLELMLMCYSPGVMDGDHLDLTVTCNADTEMKLFTQSFNKLHPMKAGASQITKIHVVTKSIFQFLPFPTIPYKDAIFEVDNIIKVDEGGHLIWGDIMSGGRIHSNERFEFKKVHSRTKIYYGNKLVVYDNLLLEPSSQPIEGLLFFEGFTHQATLLIVSHFALALKLEMDEIFMEQFSDLSYGYTQSNENTILLRAMGHSGDAIHHWLTIVCSFCWSFIKFHKEQERFTAAALPETPAMATEEKQPVKKEAKKKTSRPRKKTDKEMIPQNA